MPLRQVWGVHSWNWEISRSSTTEVPAPCAHGTLQAAASTPPVPTVIATQQPSHLSPDLSSSTDTQVLLECNHSPALLAGCSPWFPQAVMMPLAQACWLHRNVRSFVAVALSIQCPCCLDSLYYLLAQSPPGNLP